MCVQVRALNRRRLEFSVLQDCKPDSAEFKRPIVDPDSLLHGGGIVRVRIMSTLSPFDHIDELSTTNVATAILISHPDRTAVNVNTSIAPHFGVNFKANDAISVSGTVHTEQKFVVDTQFGAMLPDGKKSQTTRTSIHNFVPLSAGLGADFVFDPHAESRFGVVATMVFERWSDYVDRHGERPDQYGSKFGWNDTFTGAIGLRYEGVSKAQLDFNYRPSPVPEQVGRSNYVDNDRLSMAFGISRAFEIGNGVSLAPGGQFQVHRLLPRYQAKDDDLIRDEFPDGAVDDNLVPIASSEGLQTNNPGWPGFQSQGWIFGGGVTVSLIY